MVFLFPFQTVKPELQVYRSQSITCGDRSLLSLWTFVLCFVEFKNSSVQTSLLLTFTPELNYIPHNAPRATPEMRPGASLSFPSVPPTTPTSPLGHGPWPGSGWRRRRRRGSYGGGGLCREVRQRRRGESRVLWCELKGGTGGAGGWAVSELARRRWAGVA